MTGSILIVEDDPNTASLVSLYLEREGFQVVTAGDGDSGLAMARRHRPDLVILDVMMPETSGYELCRQLRERYDQTELPIVLLTARAKPEELP